MEVSEVGNLYEKFTYEVSNYGLSKLIRYLGELKQVTIEFHGETKSYLWVIKLSIENHGGSIT